MENKDKNSKKQFSESLQSSESSMDIAKGLQKSIEKHLKNLPDITGASDKSIGHSISLGGLNEGMTARVNWPDLFSESAASNDNSFESAYNNSYNSERQLPATLQLSDKSLGVLIDIMKQNLAREFSIMLNKTEHEDFIDTVIVKDYELIGFNWEGGDFRDSPSGTITWDRPSLLIIKSVDRYKKRVNDVVFESLNITGVGSYDIDDRILTVRTFKMEINY